MWDRLSHYFYPLNWIPELPFRLVQIVFFISCICAWERKMCWKETRIVNKHTLNLRKQWNLASSFLLLPQTWLTEVPRIKRVCVFHPCFTSCSAHMQLLLSQQTSPIGWGVLFLISSDPHLYFLAKDKMEYPREFPAICLHQKL